MSELIKPKKENQFWDSNYIMHNKTKLSTVLNNSKIYSTTEKEIAVWIDGKTIYRKVVEIPKSVFGTGEATSGTAISYSHGIANIDKVIFKYVFWFDNSGQRIRDLPGSYYSTDAWDIQAIIEKNYIVIELGSSALNRIRTNCDYMYVILEYTKN